MLICPMCKKEVSEPVRSCPRCQADLTLLVDYVDDLREGLDQAEQMTRDGQLAEAIWAYLEILEVDPENTTARRQVGRVAAAVRHFDRVTPGRRWLRRLGRKQRWRDWWSEHWWQVAAIAVLALACVLIGYFMGCQAAEASAAARFS